MYGDDSDNDTMGLCPLGCGCEDEIKFHYMTCIDQPGYSQVIRETNSLEQYLTTRNTHPDIKAILVRSIRSYLIGTTPTFNWITNNPIQDTSIHKAFDDQCAIGWKNFFIGHISSQWKLAQDKWYTELSSKGFKLPRHQTSQIWATNLCRLTMFFALNRWQIRNEAFHDKRTK